MRYLVLLLLSVSCCASDSTCLVIKHASAARQAFISGANWQYVAGDFPKGMKWKSNVTDRYVRKVKENGGHVATVPQEYSSADLKSAFETCKAETEQAAK